MKVSELSIGDWVMSTHPAVPRPIRVKEIYDRNVGYKNGVLHMSFIEPIPLTPEILEKNGFSGEGYAFLKLDDDSWMDYYYHEHRLRKWWEGVDEWQNHAKVMDITFQCHCRYVHELQHALRLAGVEMEIEL